MKKFLISIIMLFVTAIVVVGLLYFRFAAMCGVAIEDVREAETIVLRSKSNDASVYGIAICGCGKIDGEATISLLHAGEMYKTVKLSGTIDFEWGGDWYSQTAEIRYEPVKVRSGYLTLLYRFHD